MIPGLSRPFCLDYHDYRGVEKEVNGVSQTKNQIPRIKNQILLNKAAGWFLEFGSWFFHREIGNG